MRVQASPTVSVSPLIIIQLGGGSLQAGFPLVTAQLWEHPNGLPEQFTGSLPAAPDLQQLSQSWQALYRALCAYSPLEIGQDSSLRGSQIDLPRSAPDDAFEINDSGIQQVSSHDFEDLCKTLSDEFNQWLCTSDFSAIDRPLRSRLSIQDNIRIILTTQDDPIRRLPWQRWHLLQDFPKAEIALSLTQYRRQTQTVSVPRPTPRILAILGNTQGINLTQEQQLLSQLPQAEVEFLIEPSREQFHQALWETTGWDLLFFAGHSSSEGSQVGRLYLNNNDNPKQNSLRIDELSEALTEALNHGLKLAIFNSCDGLGLANQLATLNIPQVIVMREPVPNRVAQQFFQSFLQAYVQESLPLYTAIKRSRRQLQSLEGDFPGASWLPILCQNPAEVPLDWADICQTQTPEPSLNSVSSSAPSRQDYRDRQIFLNKVRNAWIKGVLNKSLPSQAMLNMRLVEHPKMVQTPAELSELASSGYPLPTGTQISDYFEQLGLGRSLLLLGKPGAGKTIALLNLAQTLIDCAENNVYAPMPVVLNLSDWGVQKKVSRKKQPSIDQWLQDSLSRYYQVPKAKTEQWLQSGELTLLLDGLDEVPTVRQSDCIHAINQFRQDYRQVEIVLCCRQEVYQSTETVLALQMALVLQHLLPEDIDHYCTVLGETGQALQVLLASDRLLQTLATSPLMLNIIALAAADMEGTDRSSQAAPHHLATEVSIQSPSNGLADRRHRLLNAYTDRMLSRRSRNSTTTPAATISGLRFLAQQLQSSGKSMFQLEAIQPDWLTEQSRKVQYPILLGVTLSSILSIVPTLVGLWLGGVWVALSVLVSWGLIGGSLSGFIGGWLGGLTGGLIGGSLNTILLWILVPRFSLGLIITPILAIFMGFIFGACHDRIEPVERFRWSWKQAFKWLILGLGVGTLLSLPILLADTVEGRVMTPTVALIFMLFRGFSKRSHLDTATVRPNEGIWRTGQNALQIGLISTLVYGLISWGILALNTTDIHGDVWGSFLASLSASLPFGAIAGGIMGTGMGLAGADGSGAICIQHLVVRLMLWKQNRIPWNYAQFLDDCANRVLLRKVGGSYIFIHRILLEHFADWRPSR